MKRREFIATLGAVTLACPKATWAQQKGKIPTIGFLSTSTSASWSQWTPAFVGRLRELGWVEGITVSIEYRWADGISDRFAKFATELVQLNVDVIVTSGGALLAAKQATSTIPIVFTIATDPVGSGLVPNLARPGGNITGLSAQGSDLVGKRLELLRDVVPGFKRLAVVANGGYAASGKLMGELHTAARILGLEILSFNVRTSTDIAAAFESMKGQADAIYVPADPVVNSNRVQISTLAVSMKLPTMSDLREYVASGCLMSYGPSFPHLFRRAAEYVDKILRGAQPGEIPIEQPTKLEHVVNLTTAKALGLKISESFLLRADEVIE